MTSNKIFALTKIHRKPEISAEDAHAKLLVAKTLLKPVNKTIPEKVDWKILINDLKLTGMLNREIEEACQFNKGYIAQVHRGYVRDMPYPKGAALYNLWLSKCQVNGH